MASVPVDNEAYVRVHALRAGHFTLPEHLFVHPSSDTARQTVPSLSFLIEHVSLESKKTTRIVFDLGLRHPSTNYPTPIQAHLATRRPMSTEPNVVQSLAAGGLSTEDVDYVVYSHVHWDHIGDPKAFDKSTFVVGPGTLALLNDNSAFRGSHSFFEPDLLPLSRTIELPPTTEAKESSSSIELPDPNAVTPMFTLPWAPHGSLPRVMDIFQDGSVMLVDAPGHLPGHINLLARTGPSKYNYLAGDACHDRRILSGERTIGEWSDEHGHICCVHADKRQAERTIAMIQQLETDGVEVILAHDYKWEEKAENQEVVMGPSEVDRVDSLGFLELKKQPVQHVEH
ncbi:hypothetical protein N7457_007864 [Penicillium paradoxum]|uniref:uncharacterized protein n=1 Tax=Penicillium paradoxum TaxID=176176 RepID=UPI0025472995|nr:uncharacterized protein N7457_007864 [Penicillium paradoxum]KAJ5772968.1 hypothetical protein N7457_007864 [Penicillium paradoxum]